MSKRYSPVWRTEAVLQTMSSIQVCFISLDFWFNHWDEIIHAVQGQTQTCLWLYIHIMDAHATELVWFSRLLKQEDYEPRNITKIQMCWARINKQYKLFILEKYYSISGIKRPNKCITLEIYHSTSGIKFCDVFNVEMHCTCKAWTELSKSLIPMVSWVKTPDFIWGIKLRMSI